MTSTRLVVFHVSEFHVHGVGPCSLLVLWCGEQSGLPELANGVHGGVGSSVGPPSLLMCGARWCGKSGHVVTTCELEAPSCEGSHAEPQGHAFLQPAFSGLPAPHCSSSSGKMS